MKESTTAALVLVFVLASADAARAQEHSEINFGDDSSRYANDGECDDSRFIVTGGARTGHPAWSTSAHARRDATDCRAELEAGSVRWPTASERWDRFRLWTACSDVNLEVLWPDLKEDQGTRLETIIRSRLRSARIFGGTENRVPVFNVTVEIGYGNMVFYDTTSSLSKWSTDTTTGYQGSRHSWRGPGNFGYAARVDRAHDSIAESVRGMIDQFIDEYLRVNEPACD